MRLDEVTQKMSINYKRRVSRTELSSTSIFKGLGYEEVSVETEKVSGATVMMEF